MNGPLISLARRLPGKSLLVRGVAVCKRTIRNARVRRYRARARRPSVQQRVLVVMNAGVGNAVAATPLVQAIRMHWPRAHLLILPPPVDLFDGWCVVDGIVSDPADLASARFDHTFIAWMAELPSEAARSAVGRVLRAEGPYNRWLLKPEPEQNMTLIRSLGYRGLTPPLCVSIAEPADPPRPVPLRIALVPGGNPEFKFRHKRWPFFRPLAGSLLSAYPQAQLCLVGGPDDVFPGDMPESPRVLDLRGRLTWRETAWVLRHSQLVIGNDCGPMHVADAVMSTTLVLFGPTCDLKNGPRYRGITLSRDVECSPCHYTPAVRDACEDPRCMRGLTVDAVMADVARSLQGTATAHGQRADQP